MCLKRMQCERLERKYEVAGGSSCWCQGVGCKGVQGVAVAVGLSSRGLRYCLDGGAMDHDVGCPCCLFGGICQTALFGKLASVTRCGGVVFAVEGHVVEVHITELCHANLVLGLNTLYYNCMN